MKKTKLYSEMTEEERSHYDELVQVEHDLDQLLKTFRNKMMDICKAYAHELAHDILRDMLDDDDDIEGDDRK